MTQQQLDEKFADHPKKEFKERDLVLYYDKAKAMQHHTKLESKWKGPYRVEKVLQKGAYKLSLDGQPLKTTVNGNLLKLFHSRSAWMPIIVVEQQNL